MPTLIHQGMVRILLLFICVGGAIGIAPMEVIASEKTTAIPLQPIIDRAASGEVIRLDAGEYSGPVQINKPLSIIGNDEVTLVNRTEASAIVILADGVSISGLDIAHYGKGDTASVYISGDQATVRDVVTKTQGFGIMLRNANHVQIQNCTMIWGGEQNTSSARKGNGIDLYNSQNVRIEDNEIQRMRDAIYMENSRNATVKNNKMILTRYGIHCMYIDGSVIEGNEGMYNITGAMVMGVKNVQVRDNSFRMQSGNVNAQGILLYDVQNSTVERNALEGNRVGIYMEGSSNNQIQENDLRRNFVGIQMLRAEGNMVTNNTFISNVIEAEALKSQHNTVNQNYWDSFQGLDLEQDGYSNMSYAINPFYQSLVNRNEAYQLFFQSPGLGFLSSLFTDGQETWAKDASPRMSPLLQENVAEDESDESGNVMWIGVFLLEAALIVILYWRFFKT
ncbi:hypothetical protein D3C74_125660 [compost metagenome]